MREMGERGRQRNTPKRGEENPKAKLTEKDVRSIRRRYQRGDITMRELAAIYGVTFAPIQLILAGKTWRHVQ
jgi:hypothetical protein